MVLVAMLISCRCSSVSVWKRRMEEPEEKAIQTPLPAFTMCVTLTASSWCASKLCYGTEGGVLVWCWDGPASSGSGGQNQHRKETSEALQWDVGKCLQLVRGILVCRVCRFSWCKYL